jgi:two-component system NtrC family sensor kinase
VLDSRGQRAIGTLISAEVKRRVLDQGERWTARAFVVRDWYITAYEPIADVNGRTVGMLYVGVLEAKYADLRRKAMLVFVLITAAGMVLAVALGSLLSSRMLNPMQRLIEASHRVSQGDLSPEIGPAAQRAGVLQRTSQEMLAPCATATVTRRPRERCACCRAQQACRPPRCRVVEINNH